MPLVSDLVLHQIEMHEKGRCPDEDNKAGSMGKKKLK